MNGPLERISLFGMDIDCISLDQAVLRIGGWIAERRSTCRYIVTPNLDHVMQFEANDGLRRAYANAAMIVADGWPIVAASRIFGSPLPERIAGSDLVPAFLDSVSTEHKGNRVFLLGAAPGVAEVAAENIHRRWPALCVVGTYSPPFGFERDPGEKRRIASRINSCDPDLLIVGFGAPKQELWLSECHNELSVGVAIAAGATIDFLAGRQTRAPLWVRRTGLEWTHRLLTNPRRLARRYALNALHLPRLLYREYYRQKGIGGPSRAFLPD